MGAIGEVAIMLFRYILPLICILLLLTCAKRMFKIGKRATLGRLVMNDNPADFEINSMECSVGRSKICDVRLNINTVSRRHAVITYNESYGFKISAVGNAKILVNGIEVDGYAYLEVNDVIEIGGVKLTLKEPQFEDISSISRPRKSSGAAPSVLLLTLFQLIVAAELLIHYADDFHSAIPVAFGVLIAVEWVYFIFKRFSGNIQVEILGFFLTTFGFAVAASAYPKSLTKQMIAFLIGFAIYVAAGFLFKSIELTMKFRYIMAGGAVLLFIFNLIFGVNIYGAKNWIQFGPITLQPSELIKFAFIFAGSATLERLLAKRNILLFLGFSGFCLGALVLMRDFGTASIYFVTMLIIMYMRSGDIKIISAVVGSAGIGAFCVAKFVPYVSRRFSTYRHAWEYASGKGYQQTRTMIAIASGGLLGLGGGRGNLDKVAAADTDLVFGLLCEEWGMILALCAVAVFVIFAIYSLRCTPRTNSAFYAISACAAAGLFIFQISLNIFGSTDLLPLTGVTMPFISNGGSSMIASWAMLSFIKAVGTQVLSDE